MKKKGSLFETSDFVYDIGTTLIIDNAVNSIQNEREMFIKELIAFISNEK